MPSFILYPYCVVVRGQRMVRTYRICLDRHAYMCTEVPFKIFGAFWAYVVVGEVLRYVLCAFEFIHSLVRGYTKQSTPLDRSLCTTVQV